MSDDDRWIVIPRWEEFQHPDAARSTVPPWIKTYTRLLSDDDYLGLSPHRRAVLHGLWLEYARSVRHVRVSTASLTRRLGLRVTMVDLNALNDAGFIVLFASRPASTSASRIARVEKRREEDPLTPSPRGNKSSRAEGTNPRALAANAAEAGQAARRAALHTRVDDLVASWNGGTSADFADALDAIERECGARLDFLDREEVMDRALLGGQDDEIF